MILLNNPRNFFAELFNRNRRNLLLKNLFEYSDILRSPIEAFSCSSETFSMPVVSHWHYFTEVLYLQEGSLLVSCNDVVYPMEAGSFILFRRRQSMRLPRIMTNRFAFSA